MKKRKPRLERIQLVAYHEAGHVVMSCILKRRFEFVSIEGIFLTRETREQYEDLLMDSSFINNYGWIRFKNPFGKRFFGVPAPFGNYNKRVQERINKHIKIALAGPIAEGNWKKLLNKPYKLFGHGQDYGDADKYLSFIIENEAERRSCLRSLSKEVALNLTNPPYWKSVVAISKALIKHKRLTYQQAQEIIKP